VLGTASQQLRTAVARTGVDVLSASDESTTVSATPEQAVRRALGSVVVLRGPLDLLGNDAVPAVAGDFPPGDEGYHTYAETTAALQQAVQRFPAFAKRSSVGKSFEARDLN
jgi:hypothetical protein